MPTPSSYLQWLHQTYASQWKGSVDISTVAGEDHAPKQPHWISTIIASGAVVKSKSDGKNTTLEPITGVGEARSKKEAEQQAAQQVYDQLVAEGWWDPEAPSRPKKTAGVSRANRFLTDSTPSNEFNPLAYLDVSIDGQAAGRIVFELFRYKKGSTKEEHAPLAVDNFLALCRGVDVGGKRLSYVGVPFTRVIRRFVIQAGDVVNKDGTGGAHIHSQYGENFPDEGLEDKNYRHTFPFMLSCANLGLENTNSSQFFITTSPCANLDGYHTCFGKVLRGYGTVKEIEALHERYSAGGGVLSADESPPVPVVITAAGELAAGTQLDDDEVAPLIRAEGWPLWAEDQGPPPEGVREVAFRLDISTQLRQAGNKAYKEGDAVTALARYRQAYQYLSWTTFKHRLPDGDADLTYEEQDAIWSAEGVLLCNMVAAQIKLGHFRAAVMDTCPDLLRKAPDNPKAYLRAAQARIGVGPSEFDAASMLLQEALSKAKAQGTPTRDIVEELHRLKSLQKQHGARLRDRFAKAFAEGILHHPADDQPAPLPTSSDSAAGLGPGSMRAMRGSSMAQRTWRGKPVGGGPVAPEHVLDDISRPVVVEDAWGTHLLMADEEDDEEHEAEASMMQQQQQPWGRQRLADMLLQQQRLQPHMGPSPSYGPAGGPTTAMGDEDGWWGAAAAAGGAPGGGLYQDEYEEEGTWWRDEHDDDCEEEGGSGRAAGCFAYAQDGDEQHPQQHGQQHDLKQQPDGVTQQAAGANGCHIHAAETGGSAAGAADVAGANGAKGASHEGVAAEGGQHEEEYEEPGVPEAEDVASHSTSTVNDSTGVSKQGYGWKPEVMPRWTRLT